MSMRVSCRVAVVASLFVSMAGYRLTASGATPEWGVPVLRVPQMARAPVLDGKVDPAEWADAETFTGVSGNPIGTAFLLPEAQQVVWWLGFRGDMLYIGMRSPHPKGTFPAGRVKDMDDPNVLWGDHVEIQILTHERGEAGKPGKGFYKMVINAWGAMQDSHYFNGTPGTEDLWSTGGDVKCTVTDREWQMEVSVKAQNIKLPRLDGQKAVIQLVRAADTGGMYFAGLVGTHWMAWDRFAEVVFDAQAPVLAFQRLGELMEGRLDLPVTITGSAAAPQTVDAEVLVEDAAGKVLFQDKQTATVAQGEHRELAFRAADLAIGEVALDGGRNQFQIRAVWRDGKQDKILYLNRSPFMKMTPAWRAKYWDPWVAARPQSGEWDALFAYLPYSHTAKAKVDVDFFGIPAEIRRAARFAVDVRPKGKAERLGGAETALTGGAGEVLFKLPDLADGDYEAVFTLSAGEGGKPAAEKTVPFTRKRYPFEHNTLGLSDEVIPPFVPLAVNPTPAYVPGGGVYGRHPVGKLEGDAIVLWGRVYELGGFGLFRQVLATPPTGTAGRLEPLLAAPMRLEFRAGGEPAAVTDATCRVTAAAPHRVDVEGRARAGTLGVALAAFAEYDGWYEVALTLTPKSASPLDALDLVMELRDCAGDRLHPVFPMDTLYVQRMGGGLDNSYHGEIPRKPGIVFESTTLWPPGQRTGPADIPKDWKSFAPITFAGNGDRGLWFFAWSDAGWALKDGDAMLTVERLKDGNVRLRVRLISGPVTLDKPRTLRFALQGAPIKANDVRYRSRMGEIAHDTSGYRYYGDSVDSYVLHTDADFARLREFLLYGTSRQGEESARYGHWENRLGRMLREGWASRVMLYGSQWMTGLGAEEFDSFGGEWLGRSNWKPDPETKFADLWNYGHTVQWKTPRQLSPSRVNWPRSMVDFFVWYHANLIERVGINGTWWDNCYSGTVTDYDPDLGRPDAQWNLYMRRALCKRLNVVGWEHLRPPCWSMNTQVEMAWCQVYWLVEGFWGPSAKDISTIEHFGSPGFFRAAARPKSTCMICSTPYMTHYRGSTPESDRAMIRSSDGILLLHDIPPANDRDLVRKLNYAVNYERTDECLFAGYWTTGPFVAPPSPDILASIYQNASLRAAVVVFMNVGARDQYLGGTTLNPAGVVLTPSCVPADAERPLDLARIYDLETGAPVKTAFRDGRLVVDEPLVIGRHEYRLLALEGGRR
jgi:hypothetical protein